MGLASFQRMRLLQKERERIEKRSSETRSTEGQATQAKPKESTKEIEEMTVPELKELAKAQDIEGHSTMKKKELVEVLRDVT
ncbi:hypothetical protein G4V62_13830 [Bacillaceae bacterium SIJ1]|uniref:Rho termination factor N-terminal domain-containing protein n=1 Tax=Litoribacterium kuwaitense TaxID=1398745 RepID=UPI0013EB1A1F|nr:Rho termination factor N-terminal domain-containing protein [Litoribacterium kuwaitense]NGP45974.1 hypothetical protein [Litoribacterium kuwaitense]